MSKNVATKTFTSAMASKPRQTAPREKEDSIAVLEVKHYLPEMLVGRCCVAALIPTFERAMVCRAALYRCAYRNVGLGDLGGDAAPALPPCRPCGASSSDATFYPAINDSAVFGDIPVLILFWGGNMYLVQVLLPVFGNSGKKFPARYFHEVKKQLTGKFHGLTASNRAPAEGRWRKKGTIQREEIIVYEVMTERFEKRWWRSFRSKLEKRFQQSSVVIRAQEITVV